MSIENISIDMKSITKMLTDRADLIKECGVKGHISSGEGSIVSSHGEIRAYDRCKRCNSLYTRSPTSEELKEYERLLQTNFV